MSNRDAIVVDDNPANRDFLERLLAQAQFKVQGADTGKAALDKVVRLESLALAMVDMQLPDMSGLQLIFELRQRFPGAVLVIATMHDDRALMQSAFAKGCNIFLVKPHGFMELFKRLTTMDIAKMREGPRLLIDQYGPRSFTGVLGQSS